MAAARQPPEHALYNAANPANGDVPHRTALRREKIAAREALSSAEHARLSALIERHLESHLARLAPCTLAFCWPIRNEFDARALVCRLLRRGWRACIPVVVAPAAPMRFRPWTPETAMGADPYGIPVPLGDAESPSPDIILVPLIAFDAAGYRIGYGGGYFDRTLAALVPRPATYGVGFELARTAGLSPLSHDVPMDMLVTEAGLAHPGAPRELR